MARILVACEESQAITKAFRKLGHEAFWDWYTNTDWTQGKAKTPLVDWTAAARRWARPKLSNSDKSSNGKKEIIYPSK